jgi:tetratricopeptide (TPR) repeat protein
METGGRTVPRRSSYTRAMRFCGLFFCLWLSATGMAQGAAADSGYRLELGARPGLLTLEAARFAVLEVSAKPGGSQFRIRGEDQQDQMELLATLEQDRADAPMTNEKCRDAVLRQAASEGPVMQVGSETTIEAASQPLAVAAYSTSDARGAEFYVRAFAASGDLCGDVRFSSAGPISAGTPAVREVLATVRFDPAAKASFEGIFRYAGVLFANGMPDEAAPIYEQAIGAAPVGDNGKWRRVATDRAVTAYGMGGNWTKVRALLETAIGADPEYALNYYNLACADAEEGKAADAKTHLEEAFARRANTLPGDPLPDPTEDASLVKLKGDTAFWTFVEGLEKGRTDVF